MAKLGLGAFIETSGAELRPHEARHWRRLTLALAALLFFHLELLAIVYAWDTPHRVAVVVAFVALSALAALAAGFTHYEYVRRRQIEAARILAERRETGTDLAAERPLNPDLAWLLLPVATLALLHPQVTLRIGLSAWNLYRGTLAQPRDSKP